MIAKAQSRYPHRSGLAFYVDNMLKWHAGGGFEVVMSLFGSPNYVRFDDLVAAAHQLLKTDGRTFLMPFTDERLKRKKPVPAGEAAYVVDLWEARRAMERQGFRNIQIRGLGDEHSDAMARALRAPTLKRVLRERLESTPNPHYLIVTGRK